MLSVSRLRGWVIAVLPILLIGAARTENHELAVFVSPVSAEPAVVCLTVYCGIIALASLAGGWLSLTVALTHRRMQVLISLVAGLMLGVAFFHMLPSAIAGLQSVERAIWWLVLGLLGTFFLIRIFGFHEHEPAGGAEPHNHHQAGGTPSETAAFQGAQRPSRRFRWVGVALGLVVHTLIDGIALAASVQVAANEGTAAIFFGLGTFAAILLHKPLDAISIISLMTADHWSRRWRQGINGLFALICPLGAAGFYLGASHWAGHQGALFGCALAFAAGVFLCISLSDLLPEVHFHAHDRFLLSAALLFGLALAYAIGMMQHGESPTHQHSREELSATEMPPAQLTSSASAGGSFAIHHPQTR